MKIRQIIFTDVERAELLEREISDELKPNQALVETEFTIVSPGTETRGFRGLPGVGFDGSTHMPRGATNDPESTDSRRPTPNDPPYPQITGYGQIGKVLEVGADVRLCKPGDRVLTRSPHASMVKANAGRFAVPLPEDFPGEELIFARMAGISVTGIYSSSVKPGDTVLVMWAVRETIENSQTFPVPGEVLLVLVIGLALRHSLTCTGSVRNCSSGMQC